MKKKRKIKSKHGFWIISDYSYGNRHQLVHCSVCGMPNPRPIGEFCRWCGAHMDQEELDLSEPRIVNDSNIRD